MPIPSPESEPTRAVRGAWLRNFWPAPVGISGRERLRVALGAAMGVLLAALLARWWNHAPPGGHWMVASLGASAVLVFAMPSSPLAQPWPVLGGNTLSVLVGLACAALVPEPAVAAALAVSAAVLVMVPLRCLHPPGAAMALFVVLNPGEDAHLLLFPVLFNVLVLLLVGIAYNNATGRSYPHPQRPQRDDRAAGAGQFTTADLDAALAHYNQVLDISRADLAGLLHMAGRAAFQRTLGELRCADIMSRPPMAVEPGVALKDAWAMMRSEQIKALPVVDAQGRVLGIVTVADFMRLASLDTHEGLGQRLRTLIRGRLGQPSRVEEIMSPQAQVADARLHVMDLVPLFSRGGHHHIPIVDTQSRLVGVITQSDLVRALATALPMPEADGIAP
ncbi:HPP family protein [Simplicispira lacusdiani]|uniref:HPP family protein n=1 Tax=Simplicispira lacusdiani TaxID=2213010 RepID=UPI000E73159C|nr:HPP family protein [Simplicispira lacusdiani]